MMDLRVFCEASPTEGVDSELRVREDFLMGISLMSKTNEQEYVMKVDVEDDDDGGLSY